MLPVPAPLQLLVEAAYKPDQFSAHSLYFLYNCAHPMYVTELISKKMDEL